MSNNNWENNILGLLNTLAPEPLSQNTQYLYDQADKERQANNYDKAIEFCQKALLVLGRPAQITTSDPSAKIYVRGRFYLLMASIYLNQELQTEKLNEAEQYYLKSQREFHAMQWSHLESLAYLGLAITRRKLAKFDEASDACENAQRYIDDYSIPTRVKRADVRQAIEQEREKIQESLLSMPLPSEPTIRRLPIFNISTAEDCITEQGITDINLICRSDYEQLVGGNFRFESLDLTIWPQAQKAEYILEVDDKITKLDDDLAKGSWLFIKEEDNLERLKNKVVAVLMIAENNLYASQKIFFAAEDHYFLKAKSKKTPSIVLAHYKTENFPKINEYYTEYGTIDKRYVYQVRVSGEVIFVMSKVVPHEVGVSIQDVEETAISPVEPSEPSPSDISQPSEPLPSEPQPSELIWEIPIVSNIAAGLGTIAQENIEGRIQLSKPEHREANFGVRVIGDSMTGDDIHEGDIALIRQQPTVEDGEIAAIVIKTPELESLGVLKRFRFTLMKRQELQHWLLESSNPSSEHLVVMPEGADVKTIKNLYAKGKWTDKVKFYENAEALVAGKYIGSVKSNQ